MNIQVTKEEFEIFISNYINPLEVDVAMMFEPPIKSYNDLTSDKIWPESVVAFIKMNSKTAFGGLDQYFIVKNYLAGS